MTIINLSEEYKKENRSLIKRIKLWRTPDIYWASSLSEADNYFRKSRPNILDDDKFEHLDVLIWMHNIEAIISNESESGIVDISLKDSTGKLNTLYIVNNQQKFRGIKNEFGLNEAVYVPLPEILLRYIGVNNMGIFSIADFRSHNRPRKEDSLLDKLYDLIPQRPKLAYQPNYSNLVA